MSTIRKTIIIRLALTTKKCAVGSLACLHRRVPLHTKLKCVVFFHLNGLERLMKCHSCLLFLERNHASNHAKSATLYYFGSEPQYFPSFPPLGFFLKMSDKELNFQT